tara:strand:- start:842 stop:1285 length:444 start_codon:yes stop_codon:yes gene_type:complete
MSSTNALIDKITKSQAIDLAKKYNDIMSIKTTGKGRAEIQNKLKELNDAIGSFKGKKLLGITKVDGHIEVPNRGKSDRDAELAKKRDVRAKAKASKSLEDNKAKQGGLAKLEKELKDIKEKMKTASGNEVAILAAKLRRVMKKINEV